MPPKELSLDEIDALVDEAFDRLDMEEPEQALKIGRRLEKIGSPRGFEIQGLAYQELDENKKAIRVLRRGTERVSDDWQLWQSFGSCLSNDEEYDEALKAYDKALDLTDSDRVLVGYNRCILLWRMERLGDANSIVEELLNDPEHADAEPELQSNIRAARMGILIDLGRDEDAVDYFETLPKLDELSEQLSEVARLDAKYATALWNADRYDAAQKALARAIRHDKTNSDAQWLVREMRTRDLAGGKITYDLLVHGPWRADAFPGTEPAKGFYTKYEVVANNPDEALKFAQEFEPFEIRHALKIEEIVEKEQCDEPKGVYWTSGYNFYPED